MHLLQVSGFLLLVNITLTFISFSMSQTDFFLLVFFQCKYMKMQLKDKESWDASGVTHTKALQAMDCGLHPSVHHFHSFFFLCSFGQLLFRIDFHFDWPCQCSWFSISLLLCPDSWKQSRGCDLLGKTSSIHIQQWLHGFFMTPVSFSLIIG